MGQRGGSCLDLGINMAFAETHASRVNSRDSRYIPDRTRDLGVAKLHAGNVLNRDKILINKGGLDALTDGTADPGYGRIQQLRLEYSEQFSIFDSTRGTLCGRCYDLGVSIGFAECQASFWNIPPNSDIDASANLARQALEQAKGFAGSIKDAAPGVSSEGIDWILLGYFDPEGTGNGFQVLYQRCVLGRELLERSIYGSSHSSL